MSPEANNSLTPARILHNIISDVSTIMSISQLALINHKEMPPELQTDLKRIVEKARHLSTHVKDLADVLEEEV
jgi:hypothetical protein